MPQKQVAIIGSGCSGLTAIKACVDEGLNPICFESSDDIGGLWRFSDSFSPGRGSVASTTVMNTSKEMMAYSDFPPPREFPNFMHHTKVIEYYELYADRFKLRRHIRFNTLVEHIQPSTNDQRSSPVEENNNTIFKEVLTEKPTNPTSLKQSGIISDRDILDNHNKQTGKFDCNSPTDLKDIATTNVHTFSKQTSLNYNDNEEEISISKQTLHTTNTSNTINAMNDKNEIKTKDSKHTIPEDCLDQHKTWMIRIRDKTTGETNILYFDCVLVCTGHHAHANMPPIEGQSDFNGKIIHSRDLRDPTGLAGSRHVVVGVGNSGCDMAVEVSRKSQVFLSTHRGTWLMHRLQTRGLPADIAFSNRMVFTTAFSLPNRILNFFCALHLNQKIDHELYGLRPRHGPIAAHPTVNDELPNRIACGSVVVKPSIQRLLGNSVIFEDGTVQKDIDTVIMATGYHIRFPFLDDSILKTTKSNKLPLFLNMFPPSLSTTTTQSLAVIGCVQPGGALAPVSEMQCRLAVQVFTGDVKLPSEDVMVQDMERSGRSMEDRYLNTPRHTIQVDYIPYMDLLAKRIGCKPNLGKMLITDPLLAKRCILGPCTAYQYRLAGPGSWDRARGTIMTQMDRVTYPLSTRRCEKDTNKMSILISIVAIISCLIGGICYLITAFGTSTELL